MAESPTDRSATMTEYLATGQAALWLGESLILALINAGAIEKDRMLEAVDVVIAAKRAMAITGREPEIRELDGLLDSAGQGPPTVLISAVSGTAGVGKTALAVHWAHQAADRFPDGALYLDLRGYDPDRPMTPGEALAVLLRAVQAPTVEAIWTLVACAARPGAPRPFSVRRLDLPAQPLCWR